MVKYPETFLESAGVVLAAVRSQELPPSPATAQALWNLAGYALGQLYPVPTVVGEVRKACPFPGCRDLTADELCCELQKLCDDKTCASGAVPWVSILAAVLKILGSLLA